MKVEKKNANWNSPITNRLPTNENQHFKIIIIKVKCDEAITHWLQICQKCIFNSIDSFYLFFCCCSYTSLASLPPCAVHWTQNENKLFILSICCWCFGCFGVFFGFKIPFPKLNTEKVPLWIIVSVNYKHYRNTVKLAEVFELRSL